MSTANGRASLTRRTALAGLSAGGLGVALGSQTSRAAQSMSTADHPLMGVWLAMANPPRRDQDPQYPAPSIFAADGTVILSFVPAHINMKGELEYSGSPMGVWEPYDDQTGHFTVVQVLADKEGHLAGSLTIDGHPKVSADGMTFTDDGSLVTVTIRDPAGKVVNVIPPTKGTPVTAVKMRVGLPGFPGEENATPVP
jgi:hypothetical protein